MARLKKNQTPHVDHLQKCPTGIKGLDEITGGGLPQGRPTLVCGGTGCGKSLLAMEFLVHGAIEFDQPGVFMSFEEKSEELVTNFASLKIPEPMKRIIDDLSNTERVLVGLDIKPLD